MTTMTEQLLPCPFCGASAASGNGFAPCESVTYAYCENSTCLLHTIDVGFTPDTWNRRATIQPVAAPEIDDDRLFGLADTHAEESYENGDRRFDRGGLRQFARDLRGEFTAAPAQPAPDPDELQFNAQRLRNVAKLVGLESAVPQDDATLDGARGAVLGMIAAKLRERNSAAPAQAVTDAVRDAALNALLARIDDAWTNYERMGEICPFEGQPMIYASTLEEIVELRRALSTTSTDSEKGGA